MNNVFLMGNLTRDPESRTLSSGNQVADLGLAINDNYKDKEGKLVERAVYVDVVTWGRQAETCVEFLKKGSPILVEGRLQLDQWQTETGDKRSKLRVKANRVQFLQRGGKVKESQNGNTAVLDEEDGDEPF
jgi:single-strand DNA-binding protein